MDIASVMTQVIAIQGALSITSPSVQSVKKAWAYPPPMSVTIAATDMPCFVNEWSFDREDRTTQGLREQHYTVHMLLMVGDADFDKASAIASGFMAAVVNAFDATETLNGSAFWSKLRGATPTLVSVRRNGEVYAGLELFLDVTLTEGKTYGP